MAAEDLSRAIEALEDEEVRDRVAGGDLADFAELELTDEEIALVEGAASEYPEVVGFDIRMGLMNLAHPLGQKGGVAGQDVTVNKAKTADKAAAAADAYIRG
jgi:hypothetical protein